jgi:hypothetical protein
MFLQHAQQLLDVARTDSSGENSDFALLVRHDGGIHMIMESELTLEAAALAAGAKTAYRVTRSGGGVRVTGSEGARRCQLEDQSGPARARTQPGFALLRDQPLYRITSPVLISAS